jgi:[protein-PII] uridylyltransferase
MVATIARLRADVVRRFGLPERRTALTEVTDSWLGELFAEAHARVPVPACLAAVGGHGRKELAPGSDVDLLLLHRGNAEQVEALASAVWYPIWDAGLRLDHSVRTVAEARRAAADDVKVMLGLLDARALAGDETFVMNLREAVLADWRSMAATRLDDLHALVEQRRSRFGDLAQMLEPELKEAYGGLREASVLRAISASWLVDVPHTDWAGAADQLLDVREALHAVTGRRSDVLLLQEQDAVAKELGLPDADALLRHVYQAARHLAYASDVAWYRVHRTTRRSPRLAKRPLLRRTADRVPLADGVVVQDGEVVLASEVMPERDPVLVLRVAGAAAQAGLPIAHHTLERLAAGAAPLPTPWPPAARDAFVRLLGSGHALVGAWEALDHFGFVDSWFPEWAVVRAAPQRNPMHRFTVDRHLIETVVEASTLTREVDRPDLLLVAALLHDIGKSRAGDHCDIGALLTADIAPRIGFDDADTGVLVDLVQHHLFLAEAATKRDIDDPRTMAMITEVFPDVQTVALLGSLSVADARATGPAVSSDWRLSLIKTLTNHVVRTAQGQAPAVSSELSADEQLALAQPGTWVFLDQSDWGCAVTVAAPDAPGLLATVAAILAVHRLQVRAARVRTVDGRALQSWQVTPLYGAPPSGVLLGEEIRRAVEGLHDPTEVLRARELEFQPSRMSAFPEPRVHVDTSAEACFIEVRAHDRPALLYSVARTITDCGMAIHGANVDTLGSDVIDVFSVGEVDGRPVSEARGKQVGAAILNSLREQAGLP